MNEEPCGQAQTELTFDQMRYLQGCLPDEVKALLYAYPQLFLAGGYVRALVAGESPKDIDIFTSDLSVVDEAVAFYVQQCDRYGYAAKEYVTPCTITVTGDNALPVQFINNEAYESRQKCLDKFDFTVCQAAVWHDEHGWQSLCTPEFAWDVAVRRLVYTSPDREEAPGGSLWRAFKYAQKGYSITQEELAKLVVRLNAGIDSGFIEINPWTSVQRKTHSTDSIRRSFRLPLRGGSGAVMGGSY